MRKKLSLQFRPVLLLLLAIFIFIGAPLTQPSTVNAQGCFPFYIVKPGDNLYRIAVAAGTSWQVLAALNGIYNPNNILVGQRICLPPVAPGVTPSAISPVTTTPRPPSATPRPTSTGLAPSATPAATQIPPVGGIVLPPPGVFPSFNLNTYWARIGDTLTLTGINFPTNEPVDIYITNLNTAYPATPSGSAVIAANGTLNTTLTIPASVGTVVLNGNLISILVRGRVTGYYGYNYFNRLP